MPDQTVPTYENRRFSRVPVVKPVTLCFPVDQTAEASTKNISAAGICVSSDTALPLGGTCMVTFHLDDGKEIDIRGGVVRVDKTQLAIEITGVRADTAPNLRELIVASADDPGALDTEMVSRAHLMPELF